MKNRSLTNFICSLLYQVVNLLVGLLLPKVYTEVFGSAYNGLNQTIAQILSLLSVLQMGIAAVSIQRMFKHIADKNEAGVASVYWAANKQYRKMGIYFVAAVIPIIALFPLITKNEISYDIAIWFLIFRCVSASLEYFFQAKYTVILTAHNFSFLIYIFNIVFFLLGTAFHFAVLFTTKNIIMYQSVALFIALLRFAIVGTYVNKKFPFLKKNKTIDDDVKFSSNRKDVFISEIAGLVIDSTDLIVLTVFTGLVSTSVYSVYNFVVAGIASVLSSCREAVFAGIGKTFYSDKEQFNVKMDKFERIYFFLTFFLYSVTILLFKPFILVYTANMDAVYYYFGFPLLFVLAKLVVNMRIPSILAINTAGHFKQVKYYALIEAVINLTISLLLVKPLGIYGVLIGTIVAGFVRTPILIYYSNKNIMARRQLDYWSKILLWLPIFITCVVLSEVITFNCETLISWVLIAVIVTAIVFVICVCWSLITDKVMRSEFKKIIRKIKLKIFKKA